MLSVSSRIWTRVTVSVSYDDNHYTLGTTYRPFNNPLVTVPRAPVTIGIIVTFMFYSCCFFYSLSRSSYLFFFSHSFSLILWSAGTTKSTILQVLFFCWLLYDLVFWSRLLSYLLLLLLLLLLLFYFAPCLFFTLLTGGFLQKSEWQQVSSSFHGPVGRGCRIHRLHLRRGVRPHPEKVSSIWHKTIWCRDSNSWDLGNVEYSFIAIAPLSTLSLSGSTL